MKELSAFRRWIVEEEEKEDNIDMVLPRGKETTARNFAKFVPGEGLYYKMTSEH